MEGAGGFAVPDPNTEGTYTFGAYQRVSCYVHIYAPTTVHFGTAPRPSLAQVASDSENEPPRASSSVHTVSSVTSTGFGRALRRQNLIGKRQAVLAWLIARLQRLRERISRQGPEPEVPVEERPVAAQEQQSAPVLLRGIDP